MQADIIIRGNVGKDIEWREFEFGGRTTFSVAVTPSVQRNGEWHNQPTTWYRVTCWRRLGEHVRDSLRTGDPVLISGKLKQDTWRDESNINRHELAVEARWVGHDLSRGTAVFTRMQTRPEQTAPFESDAEASRIAHEDAFVLADMARFELDEDDLASLEDLEAIDLATGEVTV